MFDTKSVVVKNVTQEMLDWLENDNVGYVTQPNLVRWRYSGCYESPKLFNIKTGDPERSSEFITDGIQIIFEEDKDRFEFALRFGEDIKKHKKKGLGFEDFNRK